MAFKARVSSLESQARVYWAASSLLRIKEQSPTNKIDEARMKRLMKELSTSKWKNVARLAGLTLKENEDGVSSD